MRKNPKNPSSQSGLFDPRVLLAFTLCSVGVFLAALGFTAMPTPAGWSLITSPNVTQNNILNGVTCVSASDCWAVGNYYGPHALQTLTEHWDGTSWAIVPSPNTSATSHNDLSAVTCASTSECWAVGYSNNGNIPQTLIERWDGTSWAIVASPNNVAQGNSLNGVTCASASECWAVGSYTYATGPLSQAVGTLIEHWIASSNSWAIVASPNNGNSDYLYSVTCPSASECWAVGSAGNITVGSNGSLTLIEHWSASSNSWAIVASPDYAPDQYSDFLRAVACASASECWAVGYSQSISNEEVSQPLMVRWDGTTWAIPPSPSPSAGGLGVTCASASDCWAVSGNIQHWDGTSWAIVPRPSSGGLKGVTCASGSECWAVGYYNNGSANQTLIEEYSPTIPPLVGVASRMTHGGGAGTFDIALPLIGTRGVECRSSAFLGAGNYTMIFSFVNNVTSCGTTSAGALSSGPGLNQCTVSLTGVANQRYTTVTLNNVVDSQNNPGNVAATMGVLIGDVNANGVVTNADVSLVKAQVATGASVGSSNFRNDVNVNGGITNADVSLTKAQVAAGAQLPTPP